MPASACSFISARVNQRGVLDLVAVDLDLGGLGAGDEAEHQAGRERPGLVAEVLHLADPDPDLLGDLTAYGVLERLARLAEARERRVAALGPRGLAAEQAALVVASRARPTATSMITAGSVRGNCALPHCVHTSSWPDLRASSRPPQRGQKRVAKCHSASPIAWKSSGASESVRPASCGKAARSPNHSDFASDATAGSTITAKQVAPSRSPSSTRIPSGASLGDTHSTCPSTGRIRVPEMTRTLVVGSAHRSVEPALVVAAQAGAVVGVRGQRQVRERHEPRLVRVWEPARTAVLGSLP